MSTFLQAQKTPVSWQAPGFVAAHKHDMHNEGIMASIHAISKGQLRMQLQDRAGPVVGVYPAFRKVLGLNATAAQFLSQCVYWTERTDDGWFYKTNAEWFDELGLTVEEVNGARRKLKALGLLSEKRKGIPPKLYYRIDTDLLLCLLSGEKPVINSGKTPELKAVKPRQRTPENPGDITETTKDYGKETLSQGADEQASAEGEGESAEAEDTTPPDQPIPASSDLVTVTLDWQPDMIRLKARAVKAGVPMDLFTGEAIGLFAVHHEAGGLAKTQSQWEAALVSWVNRDRQRSARAPSRDAWRPRTSGPDFHSGDTSWADDLGDL
ncbi:DnaT-like ssDNA-binding domain-containing protein [Azotobacter salinestris]|uniref:DnaT-like ssDNA-binding domain-containing protein n=1 Tax=Azotobacter salinestris TaxID=69964 RepID=UPI0012668B7B|nr:DnaT-like ssDNA-binding domain-containing protein [Azotobacter salinestris]